MSQEMPLEVCGVGFGMLAQQPKETAVEGFLPQHRPEGHVQYLAGVELLEQGRQPGVIYRA